MLAPCSKQSYFSEIIKEYFENNISIKLEEQRFNLKKLFSKYNAIKVAKIYWNIQVVHLAVVKQELTNHLECYLVNITNKQQMIKLLSRSYKTI